MYATRTLILAAVLTLMGDGITTPLPVVVVPDDTEAAAVAAPAAPADPATLAVPTPAEAEGATQWLTE